MPAGRGHVSSPEGIPLEDTPDASTICAGISFFAGVWGIFPGYVGKIIEQIIYPRHIRICTVDSYLPPNSYRGGESHWLRVWQSDGSLWLWPDGPICGGWSFQRVMDRQETLGSWTWKLPLWWWWWWRRGFLDHHYFLVMTTLFF